MRALLFFVILPSLFTPHTENSKKISQSFFVSNYISSIVTELNGDVDIFYWNEEHVFVETTIYGIGSSTSEYTLNYSIKKDFYQLNTSLEDNETTLYLKPKKINTTIFQKGQIQKTKQTFKLFIPKRLRYQIN